MPSNSTATFGELLREYRRGAGLTQEALAERAGLSVYGIQKLERGTTHPYRDTAQRLVLALQLAPEAEARFRAAVKPVHRQATTHAQADGILRHNLPIPLSRLIGREQALAEVTGRLAGARLLTLTGAGGCGKTRLAVEVARGVLASYPDGVWLVELAPLADPALVAYSVAAVVRVRETAGQSMIDALAARLRTRRLLLVLDNCEHLLDACARLIDAFLRACPEVRVLATSREALGLAGEVAWRVPSLPVPNPQRLPMLPELQQNPAVQLFTERAGACQPRFLLTERNAPAVAQVCARLDGIPLALELAAARVAVLPVDQIAARLDQRFGLLTAGSRAALPRQQTLRATLDWSYDLLSESERCLFNQLSVFAGGWSLEAAETVCAREGMPGVVVLDLLGRLVGKSLVVAEEDADGAERYRLLETVRQYAGERLLAAGEVKAVHQQHASYYLGLVEALDHEQILRAAAPMNINVVTLDQLEREQDNLRAALRWWIVSQDADRAVRQAAAAYSLWFRRGALTEGLAWVTELLALPRVAESTLLRGRVLPLLANLARRHGDYTVALDAYQKVLAAREAAGDQYGAAVALCDLANVHYLRADYPAALASLEASRITAGDRADPALTSSWRFVGGQVALHEGRYDLARSLLTEELAAPDNPARSLHSGYCLVNLGAVARAQGQYAQTSVLLGQGIQLAEHYGDRTLLAYYLEVFSGLAVALGQYRRGLCLAGAAAALREAIGAPLPPAWRGTVEHGIQVARAHLSDTVGTAAWQAGQEMSLQQAIEFARGHLDLAPPAALAPASDEPPPFSPGDPLTPRQQEVAVLVALGLTNRQIAERLVVTERAAAAHVGHILDKLAVGSRAQIAVWASERGLLTPRKG